MVLCVLYTFTQPYTTLCKTENAQNRRGPAGCLRQCLSRPRCSLFDSRHAAGCLPHDRQLLLLLFRRRRAQPSADLEFIRPLLSRDLQAPELKCAVRLPVRSVRGEWRQSNTQRTPRRVIFILSCPAHPCRLGRLAR